jgi:NADH-quinone oxidoreductase subunit C
LSEPAEIARAVDAVGATVSPPSDHPFAGAAEVRWIAPAHLVAACRVLRDAGYFFESMTCVDRLEAHGVFELVYTFNRFEAAGRVAFRVWAPKDQPVPSVSAVFGAANWNEREAWEFYGVIFAGHPKLTWLLLPEGTEFHPLLKSFTAPPASVYDDSLTAPPPTDDEHTSPHH